MNRKQIMNAQNKELASLIEKECRLPKKAATAIADIIRQWRKHPGFGEVSNQKAMRKEKAVLKKMISCLEEVIPNMPEGGNPGEPETCPKRIHEKFLEQVRNHLFLVKAMSGATLRTAKVTSVFFLNSIKNTFVWSTPIASGRRGKISDSIPTGCYYLVVDRILQEVDRRGKWNASARAMIIAEILAATGMREMGDAAKSQNDILSTLAQRDLTPKPDNITLL